MKKYIAVLRYLLSIHLTVLIMLSVFRVIFYFANLKQVENIVNKSELFTTAMLKGLQFDNLIACYILALPLLVLMLTSLFNKISKIAVRATNIYFITAYTLVFAISAADIPYFQYYFDHMGATIFNWLEFGGTTLGMILGEVSYYIYLAIFVILVIAFSKIVFYFSRKLIKQEKKNLSKKDLLIYIPFTLFLLGLCFLGMRGTASNYPLRVSNAYFSNNIFFNQMAINPSFYLMKNMSSSKKKYNNLNGVMNEKDAIKLAQSSLNITPKNANNPFVREIVPESEPIKANVVIVLMESMASEYLTKEYNGKLFTPYLNQLIGESYYYPNFYSSGVHTNNGIASTLYGYPTQFDKTMMGIDADLYTGLPITLKKLGYETLFFLTSNPQYDNMNSFLRENGIDELHSQDNYPREEIVNTFGIPDRYLFEYGLNELDEKAKTKNPFFATFITVSNHPPLVVPDEFKDRGATDDESIVAYADDCIGYFMENAKRRDWYKNTIFVLLGDHGRVFGNNIYGMALSYNHVPLIIHSPLLNNVPAQINDFANQTDIFPTVMGILNQSYTNNSMGIDLLKEKRRYSYFVSDNNLGCIDNEFLYIYNPASKSDALHKHRERNGDNLATEYPLVVDSMRNYAISMMISANYMVRNKLTEPQ